ncbi:hypothetical protein WM32_09070 [Burkholderia ubonensis]|uniref:hypothetical protein n=1 Tax=Burkholderia ubonensis TaxID=101571 RepID=UPI00075CA69C|nr:hypothetical protein [Burkholderia ubonensis]KWO88587.1 hypothetical protein WM32_09070 [Burkholderia ubonensis]
MITTKDNLFNVLGAEVAKSDRSELYLVAGLNFEIPNSSSEVQRVIGIAASVAGCSKASDALRAHYNTAVGIQTSHQAFCDDCGGFVTTDHVAVQFSIQKISDNPDTYRVLFVRVDAGKLAVDMKARIDNIEARLKRGEEAHSSSVQALSARLTKLGG